ncbi:MAG: hypothetical protein WC716_07270 [Chitinophagaceae bacterium]|jgi:hypothetical protein
MKNPLFTLCFVLTGLLLVTSCEKWKDQPPKDLGLTNKYCNIQQAINYNHGYPGIEDNSTCILPSNPFAGTYAYSDTILIGEDTLFPAPITFTIQVKDTFGFAINNFCGNANQLIFKADKYYRASVADSVVGKGTQLMCRSVDTLSGTVEFRKSDSSLALEFKVLSDTGISTHKGRAYKK